MLVKSADQTMKEEEEQIQQTAEIAGMGKNLLDSLKYRHAIVCTLCKKLCNNLVEYLDHEKECQAAF